MTTAVHIYTVEQVAGMLGCSPKTVQEMARNGELTGIKPGGDWVFPAGALAQRLDELAMAEAARRRKTPEPAATTTTGTTTPAADQPRPGRGKRQPRVLPKLVDLRGAPNAG